MTKQHVEPYEVGTYTVVVFTRNSVRLEKEFAESLESAQRVGQYLLEQTPGAASYRIDRVIWRSDRSGWEARV